MAKTKAKAKAKSVRKKQPKRLPSVQTQTPEQFTSITEEIPSIGGYTVIAEQTPAIITQDESDKRSAAQLTAQELLDKPLEELEKDFGKREAQNMVKNMKILTAIMLGKITNKELAQVLNTDKSFTSKQIKALEEQGLVTRAGEGKETKYEVDRFNVMKFLESKVVIKWGTRADKSAGPSKTKDLTGFARESKEDNAQKEGKENGRTEKNS